MLEPCQPHDIVHSVLYEHRGIPKELAKLTNKSDEIYASHGREPKTSNPVANGNVSPVTHYMRYVRLFEVAEKGAGSKLNQRVFNALDAEFNHEASTNTDEVECAVIAEVADVLKWVAKFDIATAKIPDLHYFETQCAEVIDAVSRAMADSRAARILRGLERRKERAA